MEMHDTLGRQFEAHRPRLRAVARRMLGSTIDAEDAVQETWLRLSRADAARIDNLGAWLTTAVGRACLDMLRARSSRREQPLEPTGREDRVPDPVVAPDRTGHPEQEALLADALESALHVVLDTLSPTERAAFVLHDVFGVPFDEIARVIDRSPAAARKLASRARQRVRGATIPSRDTLDRQREMVAVFLTAARDGDLDGLLAILAPGVVLRADYGNAPPVAGRVAQGAKAVANEAILFRRLADPALDARPAIVNGSSGRVVYREGEPYAIMAFTFDDERIVGIDILVDPERLPRIDLSHLDP